MLVIIRPVNATHHYRYLYNLIICDGDIMCLARVKRVEVEEDDIPPRIVSSGTLSFNQNA